MSVVMDGVREYAEGMPVKLTVRTPLSDSPENDRLTVSALNEAGYNGVDIDLLDLLAWVKTHRPELWEMCK